MNILNVSFGIYAIGLALYGIYNLNRVLNYYSPDNFQMGRQDHLCSHYFDKYHQRNKKVHSQSDRFPNELLKLAGELGLDIVLSIYPIDLESILEKQHSKAKQKSV